MLYITIEAINFQVMHVIMLCYSSVMSYNWAPEGYNTVLLLYKLSSLPCFSLFFSIIDYTGVLLLHVIQIPHFPCIVIKTHSN